MKIAIIGSGISGLAAARSLSKVAEITIFEKSRGIGGRIATRRANPFTFDHGAQYFSVKNDYFEAFISPYIKSGVVKRWDAYFKEFEEDKVISERKWDQSFPHYVGAPSMNAFCKSLSDGLNIVNNTRVQIVSKSNNGLKLVDENQALLGTFDWVLSTIPSKQAVQVLPSDSMIIKEISTIKMSACFTLMLGFEKNPNLGFEAAMIHNEIISWVSVNSSKPDRNSNNFSLVIQSTNKWADKNLVMEKYSVKKKMIEEASAILKTDINEAVHKEVHGWHFANAPKRDLVVFIDPNMQIAACGDWCMHGRVESAYLSGKEMAGEVIKLIT